jgi:hypothetical protein
MRVKRNRFGALPEIRGVFWGVKKRAGRAICRIGPPKSVTRAASGSHNLLKNQQPAHSGPVWRFGTPSAFADE